MDDSVLRGLVGLAGVPLVLALTQVFKRFINDTRYYPLISLALGLVLNTLVAVARGQTTGQELALAAIQGMMAGLAASGLYSAGSTLKGGAAVNKAHRPRP